MHARTQKPWATFDCLDCEEEFQVRWAEGDDDPECPSCWRERAKAGRFEDMLASGVPPAVSKGVHGADVTYRMLERDTGITDLKDNLREGDVAHKSDAPRSKQEQNDLIRAEMQMLEARAQAPQNSGINPTWNGTASSGISPAMAQGKAAMEAARAQGAPDPLAAIESIKKSTPGPRFNVVARADAKGNVMPAVRRRG